MSEKFPRKAKPPRQDWQPAWPLQVAYRIWMFVFGTFKLALGAAFTVLIIVGICGLVLLGAMADYVAADILPTANDVILEDEAIDQPSTFYYVDSDGEIQILQELYAESSQKSVSLEDVPEDLIHAAVAIEDKRFFEHQGVDWFRTVKSFIQIFMGDASEGGSTITQQLVKNNTGDDSATVQRKLLEICRASLLERRYHKDVILEHYLNIIYLSQGCKGVGSAAKTYFGKEVQKLTLAECATLISITNNPWQYDPYENPRDNRERRNLVLSEMLDQGWITQEEYDQAAAEEIVSKTVLDRLFNDDEITPEEAESIRNRGLIYETVLDDILADFVVTQEEYDRVLKDNLVLKSKIELEDRWARCPNPDCGYQEVVGTLRQEGDRYYCPNCGTEIQVTTDASEEVYSWFTDTVLEDVAHALADRAGRTWNDATRDEYVAFLGRAGYSIYTTIDMDVQRAIDAVYEDLSQIPTTRSGQQLQSGMVVIDNETGDIVGIAGGVGQKLEFDAWNRAVDASLQTGSAIKPLTVYSPGFEQGTLSPATVLRDLPQTYGEDGSDPFPLNDVRWYGKSRTVYEAVQESVNACAVNAVELIGLRYSFDFGRDRFGLSGLLEFEDYGDGSGRGSSDIGYAPLGLGALTYGLSVREMATAYATLANNGVYRQSRTFTKVYDRDGNLILDNTQEVRQILSAKTVNYMNYCLRSVVVNGTGSLAAWPGMELYGKTGSSAEFKDRWFCGFTSHYSAAVWSGYDWPETISVTGNGSSNPSCDLFRKVMEPIHEGLESESLYSTSGMQWVTVCLDSGKLATDACKNDVRSEEHSRVATVLCYPEDVPTESCDLHVMVDWCTVGGGVATAGCRTAGHVEQRGLLKMTLEEMDELRAAKDYNLRDWFLEDDYVYLVDENGQPGHYEGFYGQANRGVDAPYLMCPIHGNGYTPSNPQNPSDPSDPWGGSTPNPSSPAESNPTPNPAPSSPAPSAPENPTPAPSSLPSPSESRPAPSGTVPPWAGE